MSATEEVEFRAADLIGSAGVGGNGEKLVQTLDYHYPRELQAALLRRENVALTSELDGDTYESVAKIAGVEKVELVKVRGGERNSDDAWVTYAYIDGRGDVVKGAFPYPDLGSSSSDGHISQRDSVLNSPAARDHLSAQAKAAAAPSSTEAPASSDPIANYEAMDARDVVAYLDDNPDRVDIIQALESATRGDRARKSIMGYEAPDGDEPDGDSGDTFPQP